MPLIKRHESILLVVDIQDKLMPVIHDGEGVIRNVAKLVAAADILGVETLYSEQSPRHLGRTVPEVIGRSFRTFEKTSFDLTEASSYSAPDEDTALVVAGCEAHVCVLQSVLGMLATGRRIYVVADAIGSRTVEDRDRALARMSAHGADVVTSEMVLFEWLETSAHPAFHDVLRLIKSSASRGPRSAG